MRKADIVASFSCHKKQFSKYHTTASKIRFPFTSTQAGSESCLFESDEVAFLKATDGERLRELLPTRLLVFVTPTASFSPFLQKNY